MYNVTEVSFKFHSYCNYVQLIKVVLYQAANFVGRTISSLCSYRNSLYKAIRQNIHAWAYSLCCE